MFLGGKIELRLGPRLAATLGSCLLVGAPLLSSGVTSLWGMTFTYGVLFGFGGGLTYTVPLVCGYRWEPKRKGLVSGMVLSGFGLSALVFNQVQAALANPGNLKPDVEYKVRREEGKEEGFDWLVLDCNQQLLGLIRVGIRSPLKN